MSKAQSSSAMELVPSAPQDAARPAEDDEAAAGSLPGLAGFIVLGTVFLVVTGGKALYADMGHFGRRPIRWTWFVLVLPSLLLNNFGHTTEHCTSGSCC